MTQPTGLTANINPASLTVTGETAASKTYDRTTTASISTSGASLSGVVQGDTVNLVTSGVTGTFASANAGTGVAVTVAGNTISGASASNYTVTQPTGLTANINPASLTVTANNQTSLFGMPDPTLTYTTSGLVSSDSASIVLSGSLTRQAGQAAGNYSILQGTLAANSNYSLAYVGGVLQIVPQVLAGDSSSFPFGVASGISNTSIAPSILNTTAQTAMQSQTQAIKQQSKEAQKQFVFDVGSNANNPDWDKLLVLNGGMRLPEFASN